MREEDYLFEEEDLLAKEDNDLDELATEEGREKELDDDEIEDWQEAWSVGYYG